MKILIISPGKMHDATVADGVTEYQTRLGKRFDVVWEFPRPSTKEIEAKAIHKSVTKDDFVVLLDEHGQEITTENFAISINAHMQGGVKRLVFIIGGAYGVDDSVKSLAQKRIKISSFVLPHMLVRLVLIEQIYRAMTIIDGGKYHHT